jgi:hypothetical protein
MRKLFTATFVAILLLGALAARPAAAAEKNAAKNEKKPVLIVSFAGYDRLLQNLKSIGELVGQSDADKTIDGLITVVTGGNGLAGLDKARPWGLAVFAGEDGKNCVQGYVPVTDLKRLASVLPALPGTNGPLAADADGVYEIASENGTAYMAQKGNWAVLADNRDGLKPLVANPTELLGATGKKYLFAVRADVKNLPTALRNELLSQAKAMLDLTSQKMPEESDEEFGLRTKIAKQNLLQLGNVFKELDSLTLGLSIDPHSRAISVDLDITAMPGSKIAQQIAGTSSAETSFAGFLMPGAALTAIAAGSHSASDVAEAKEMLTSLRAHAVRMIEGKEDLGKEQQDLLKQWVGDVMDVINGTLDTRKSDSAMAVLLDGQPTLVAGAAVADTGKLEKAIKQLLGDPKLAALVKFDADKYEGIEFHVAKLPISDPQAAELLGKKIEIAVGCGNHAVYLGAGKDSLKILKRAIDGSKKTPDKIVPSLQIELGGAPIAKFIAQVAPDAEVKEKAENFARALARVKGKDHFTLTMNAAQNGVNLRLSLEEGFTKAIIGAASAMSTDTSLDHTTGSDSDKK